MQETDKKSNPTRINLWQRIWLLTTTKSAAFSLTCDREERFITAELLLEHYPATSSSAADSAHCLACESEAGRSEGQEATFTIMLQRGATNEESGGPGEGAHRGKHSSLPQATDRWETIPKESQRITAGWNRDRFKSVSNCCQLHGQHSWKSKGWGIPLAPFHPAGQQCSITQSLQPNVGISRHFVITLMQILSLITAVFSEQPFHYRQG